MTLFNLRAKYQQGKISKSDYITQMYKLHKQLFEYSQFIHDTDIASIEIKDESIIMTSRETGIKMLCIHPDQRIAPIEILNFGDYEKPILSMIFKLIKPNFTIFDIGTNIGWYTLNIAKIFPDAKIFSFEPIPLIFGELKANLDLNGFKNVEIHNFGFSDREDKLTFYVNPEETVSASLKNISESTNIQEIACFVKRLDDFVVAHDVENLDFIKCDVEGAELLVFKGGLKAIKQYQPIIFAEMLRKWSAKFNYHPNDIIKLLSQAGYRCFTVQDDMLFEFFNMDENTVETNFFFLHGVKHADQIEALMGR